MAQHSSPQSIGSGNLQGEGNPDPDRRDDKAARDFDEASQPDKASRKADDPSDDGDVDDRSNEREEDASSRR